MSVIYKGVGVGEVRRVVVSGCVGGWAITASRHNQIR